MDARDAARLAREYLRECGFPSVQVLAVKPENGRIEVRVDVGSLMERVGTVVIDVDNQVVISSDVPKLS